MAEAVCAKPFFLYTLYIIKVSFLEAIFGSILTFAATFVCIYIPLCITVGHWIHRKRQLRVEQEISLLANPFLYKAQPGKETLVSIPINILLIRILRKLAEQHQILSPEDEVEMEKLNALLEKLLRGETIK